METLVGSVQPGPRGSQVGGEPRCGTGVSQRRRRGGSLLNVSPLGVGYAGQGLGSSDEDRAPARKGFGGEVGGASRLPGAGRGTALEGEGPGGYFCPCGPAGHPPREASQPGHPRPHLEHPPSDYLARSHLVLQIWIVPSGTWPSWVLDCLLQFSEKTKFLKCGAQFSFSANGLRSFSKLCFIIDGK